ncbi:MAG: hypothetical protein ACI4IT_07495 [Oscillospiraceae bacterium]
MDVLKLIVFVCIIVGLFFICFTWPIRINRKFKEKYGSNGWSWLVSVGIAILSFITFYESGTGGKFVFLLITTILFILLTLGFCFVRAKNLSNDVRTALTIAAAQILSAFGIIFVVLVFFEAASDRKRKR